MVTDRTRIVWMMIPLACLIILTGMAAAETIGFGPATIGVAPGETVRVDVVLAEAPAGISGYRMTITIEPEGVATIDSVGFPVWAGFASAAGTPGSSVRITGVDLNGTVERNARGVILATLTLKGTREGEGTILLSDLIFDNLDEHVTPAVVNGTIQVGSSLARVGANQTSSNQGTPSGGTGGAAPSTPGISPPGPGGQGGSGSSSPGYPAATARSTLPVGSAGITAPSGDVITDNGNPTGSPGGPESPAATIPPDTVPAGENPSAKGIPFLSLPGMAGAIGAILLVGSRIGREENRD